jgi:ankyrin repeat protein
MYFLEITDPQLLTIFKLFTTKLFYLETYYGFNKKYEKVLLQSSKIGNLELIKYLVEKGVNINSKDNNGNNALLFASSFGYLKIVKYLVEKGVNIHDKNNAGNNALLFTSPGGHLKIVKYLVEKGVNIHAKNYVGKNALLFAIEGGHLEVVKYFCKLGVNENHINYMKENIFLSAVENNDFLMIKYFIRQMNHKLYNMYEMHKIDEIKKIEENKVKAIQYACKKGNLQIIKFLYENLKWYNKNNKKWNENDFFRFAIKHKQFEIANYFAKKIAKFILVYVKENNTNQLCKIIK